MGMLTISSEGIEVFSSAYPLLVGLDSSDEILVYSTVKVMHQNFEAYKNNAPGATGWRMDRQKFGQAFVPYHPGAIRYYREIGAWTEEAPENYAAFEQSWLSVREKALAEAGMITLGEGL